MGTYLGVEKTAAKRIGVSLQEYRERRAAGEKWCGACRDWHPTAAFAWDESKSDGLTGHCTERRNADARKRYARRERHDQR